MNKQVWKDKFEELEVFIKETGKRPTAKTNYSLYIWVRYNTTGRYKNSDRDNKIKRLLYKYGVTSYRKNKHQSFNDSLNELNEFLKETGRKPTDPKNSRLYNWVWLNTIGRYKTIERANKINELFEKYDVTNSTDRYEQSFNDSLNELNDFLKEKGEKPTRKSNQRLNKWISRNTTGFYKNSKRAKKINTLFEKYNVSNSKWETRFTELELLIKRTGRKPTQKTNKSLYTWVYRNTTGRYKNRVRANKINELFNKYGLTSAHKNNEQSYNEKFNDLNDFLKETGGKPTQETNHKLYSWISDNTSGRYENSDRANKICKLFDKYGLTFPPIKKTQSFNDTLNELNNFIKETGKKPTEKSNRKLCNWIFYNTNGRYENSDRSRMINDLFDKHGIK